jgi:hypothetical protein
VNPGPINQRRVRSTRREDQLERGSLVFLRYLDHVLFKDVDPTVYRPWIRETVGWFDYEDSDHVRIVWERFAVPDPPNDSKIRATGLAILKKTILEMRRATVS